jgi:hypothetical protein
MKKPKNKSEVITEPDPWIFPKDDLKPTDPFYEVSRPYRIWHEYLRISPSFALAIKEYRYNLNALTELDLKRDPTVFKFAHPMDLSYKPELTSDERLRIPDDYEEVVKTFKAMSYGGWDFSKSGFKSWWISHAADIFGYRYAPSAASIINVPHHAAINKEEIIKSLEKYESEQRLKNGNTGFALVAIPLTGNKNDVIASVNEIIKNEKFTPIQKKWEALYTLEKGKQLEKLNIGLRVLWTRALNPDLPLWKVGLKANIRTEKDGDGYKGINPDSPRQPEKYKDQISNLETMTSRKLREALIIMENAARGRFPCTNPDLVSLFDKDKDPPFDQNQMLKLVGESITKRKKSEESRQHVDQVMKKVHQKLRLKNP